MNRLYRSRKHRILGGVCGGLGEYFDIDPVFVRVIFVLCSVCGGFGFLAYLILWVVTPDQWKGNSKDEYSNIENIDQSSFQKQDTIEKSSGKRLILGIGLIIIGAVWFIDNVFGNFNLYKFWPVLLILLGVLILYKANLFSSNHKEAV